MILSTTSGIDGKKAVKHLGLVSGNAILGANSSMLVVSASGTAVVVEPE
jgi:uncharacterized protein YbjQ (UPF0145 family)